MKKLILIIIFLMKLYKTLIKQYKYIYKLYNNYIDKLNK